MTQPPREQEPMHIPLHLYGIVPRRKKGLAVAGLVLGVLSVVSFCLPHLGGLLAIIGILLSARAISRKIAKDIAVMGLVASLCGLLLVAAHVTIMTRGYNHKGVMDKTAGCGRNLSTIDRGIAIYKGGRAEHYPPNLEAILEYSDVPPERLRCPADDVSDGTSYFYCAPWNDNTQEGTAPAVFIIACDVVPAHPAAGFFGPDESNKRRNVLWSDGDIQTCIEAKFQQELQKPENRRFAAELVKGVQMTPQERVKYIAPHN